MVSRCQRSKKFLRVRFKCVQVIEYTPTILEEYEVEEGALQRSLDKQSTIKSFLFVIIVVLTILYKWWSIVTQT